MTRGLRGGLGSQPRWSVLVLGRREPSQALEEGGSGLTVLSGDPTTLGPGSFGVATPKAGRPGLLW